MPGNDEGPVRVVLLGPNLGIRQDLRQRLTSCGLEVVGESSISAFSRTLAHGADVLLVCLGSADDSELDALDRVSEERDEPMVFFESVELDDKTVARLSEKLRAAAGESRRARTPPPAPVPAPEMDTAQTRLLPVWVLGASFGGPQALTSFLGALPTLPPAALIVAQHIGDGFAEVLAQQLHRATQLNVVCAAHGMPLNAGRAYVAPIRSQLAIDERGRFMLDRDYHDDSVYSPNIDAIMTTVAECYGRLSGAIVFSGMASDGSRGARAIRDVGGTVWAQDQASCAVPSMPDRASETGAVSRRERPELLATQLPEYLDTLMTNDRPEHTA